MWSLRLLGRRWDGGPRAIDRGGHGLMCGIVGVLGAAPVDRALVERMRDRLAHRGPDAAGLWSSADGRVALGHRRLSIIDTSAAANQPFLSADGSLAVDPQRRDLQLPRAPRRARADGRDVPDESDTEVLLAAYRAWGAACVERLSGMFAFALWDAERSVLFCARDRAGEKPFHYLANGTTLRVRLGAQGAHARSGDAREVDWTSVADFLTFGYMPDPKTVWAGVQKLPPGHLLEVALGRDGPRAAEPVAVLGFRARRRRRGDATGSRRSGRRSEQRRRR